MKLSLRAKKNAVGVLSCLVIVLLVVYSQSAPAQAPQSDAVAVTTAAVIKQDVPIELAVVGNVYPYESVAIKARVDSQIAKVNFKSGDMVEKDAVLFELDARALQAQLAQLEANLKGAEAQSTNTQTKLKRDEKLVTKGFSSREQYGNSLAANDSATATMAANQAAIDNLKVQIDYAIIRSPISGRAGTIDLTQGNTVKVNDIQSLVTINQVKPILVQMAIPQRYYDAIRAALAKGSVKVLCTRNNGQEVSTGKLEYINNKIDTATGAFTARASFDNANEELWPGMFVNTVVELGVESEVHVIPLEAVQNSQTGTFVFAVDKDNKAIKRPVTVSHSVKQLAVIKSDLKPGDKVIVDNIVRITEGSKVTVITKEAGKKTEN